MAGKCISKKSAKITLWITIPILAVSIVVLVLFPTIYQSVLKKDITLTKGSLVSNLWEDIPIPLYEKLYFFNITNSEYFLNGSQKLNVTEVGPYTYKARWVKKGHLQWNSNNTVSYREIRTYEFIQDMSDGSEEDIIYTLNGPMIIASNIAKSYHPLIRSVLSFVFALENEDVIIQRSIKQLAYSGYEDFLIKYAPIVKSDLPFKNGIFSWLYGKNATDDGLFTVFTGADDPSKTDIIDKWDGEKSLRFWKGDTCNMINGTSIEIGPPIDSNQESYTFFQSIYCRSLTYNYTGDKVHYGLSVKRFKPTYDLFANSSENPENYCFEVNREHASGVLDISPCQFGSPIFISFPHFHLADPSYLKALDGLEPDEAKHGSHLDIEPITGVSVDANIRLQINLEVEKVVGIFQLYNVTEGIFPLFWVDISIAINKDFADFFQRSLKNPKIISFSVLGVLAVVSLLLSIICIIILAKYSKDDDDDPLLDAKEDRNNSIRKTASSYSEAYKDVEYEPCPTEDPATENDSNLLQ